MNDDKTPPKNIWPLASPLDYTTDNQCAYEEELEDDIDLGPWVEVRRICIAMVVIAIIIAVSVSVAS